MFSVKSPRRSRDKFTHYLRGITQARALPLVNGLSDVSSPIRIGRLRDDGLSPDAVANDGVYAAVGEATREIGNLSEVTVRVELKNEDRYAVTADAVLPIQLN